MRVGMPRVCLHFSAFHFIYSTAHVSLARACTIIIVSRSLHVIRHVIPKWAEVTPRDYLLRVRV